MRVNPIIFLLLPGTVLVGYLVGGWSGVSIALTVWSAVVFVGTVVHLLQHNPPYREEGVERSTLRSRHPSANDAIPEGERPPSPLQRRTVRAR